MLTRTLKNIFKKKQPTRQRNKLVIVETPYFNEDPAIMQANIEYARACMADCLIRRESPFLSHLLYTQIMDDRNTDLRALGIDAGLDWGKVADETIVYTDRGISKGMQYGIERAIADLRPITYRSLYKDHAQPTDAVAKHLLDACPDEVKEQLHHAEAEIAMMRLLDATFGSYEEEDKPEAEQMGHAHPLGVAEGRFEPTSRLGTIESAEATTLLDEMKTVPPTPQTINQVDRLLGDAIRRTHAMSKPDTKADEVRLERSVLEEHRQDLHRASQELKHAWTQQQNTNKLKAKSSQTRRTKRGDEQ